MSITAMKQALEALQKIANLRNLGKIEPEVVAFAAISALRTAIAEAEACEPMTEMIDAAMVEMQNIVPPLHRSECKRLIAAALSANPTPQPAPKQEPVAYLVYAKGSHKYMTLTFDTDKVPEIYKGGDVVALCAAGAQAKQVLENLDELSVGDSLFESWFSGVQASAQRHKAADA